MQQNAFDNGTGEGGSMILDEEIDENYEPTQEEIVEYARYLGMDPAEDKELLYIAREGLKAPLPKSWKPIRTREGEIYYYNFDTQQSQWEHPCDEYYKKVYREKKKAMKAKEAKPSKARGKLTDALSMHQPESSDMKNSHAGQRLEALATSSHQSNTFTNAQNAQKTQPKDTSSPLEASFSQEYASSFVSSSTPNKKNGDAILLGPIVGKSSNIGQVLEDANLDDDDDSFDQEQAKLGFSSLDVDKGKSSEYADVDRELNIKIQEVLDDQKREITQIEIRYKRELQSKRDDREDELARDLDGLRMKLSSGYLASQKKLNEEVDNLRTQINDEFERKYREKEKELRQEFAEQTKKYEKEESSSLDDELESHRRRVKEEFETKKNQLLEKKRETELNLQRIKREDERKRESINQKMNIEFKKIEEDYAQMLREVEADETIKQRRELENYQKELDAKVEQEKKILMNAQKKRLSLKESKKTELKKLYESKFEQEQEKLDALLKTTIATFEEREKSKKEHEIAKMIQNELKTEKEKRNAALSREKEEFKQALDRRLENFKAILKEKYEAEKKSLSAQVEQATAEYKKGSNTIHTEITRKEELLAEIAKLERQRSAIEADLHSIDRIVADQKKENQALRQRIEEINQEFRMQEENDKKKKQIYESLKKQLQEKNNELQMLSRNDQFGGLSTEKALLRPSINQSPNMTRSGLEGTGNSASLIKLKKEIDEIKAIVTQPDTLRSTHKSENLDIFDLDRFNQRQRLGKSMSSDERLRRLEEWNRKFRDEVDRLDKLKEQLATNKAAVKRNEDNLIIDQQKFKSEYSSLKKKAGKSSKLKSLLKTVKKNLNDQVTRLYDDIQKIRECEIQIQNQEKALRRLGEAIKCANDSDDFDELKVLYNNYRDMGGNYHLSFPLETGRSKYTDGHDEEADAKDFYNRWKGILTNQLSLDTESEADRKGTSEEGDSEEESSFDLEKKYERLFSKKAKRKSSRSKERADHSAEDGYSYNNLQRMLDHRVNTAVPDPDHFLIKREISKSSDTRNRVTSVFHEHSQWLKSIKSQLNTHIYSKPQAVSVGSYGRLFI